MTETRYAIQYSDGSFNVLTDKAQIAGALSWAGRDNWNEDKPEHLAKVVRVSITVLEVCERPALTPNPA
jgi:hypothetical protein